VKASDARLLTGSVLVLAGAAVLVAALAIYGQGTSWQRLQAGREDPLLEREPVPAPSPRPGEPFARLSIPRIDLDVTVIEGTRKQDLLNGPGHLAGSAPLGAMDNCIIAGHRDMHFRRLNRLRPGDVIRLEAGGKRVVYQVASIRVVPSDDTAVLAPTREPLLTLITCFPFRFVGPAPRRYVVQAKLATTPEAAAL